MKRVVMLCAILGMSGPVLADQALATQSGCMGCHKADAKLIGPAFKDIAAKYKGDAAAVDMLTAKVKAGSKPGEPLNWGSMMMPPSPAPEDDVRTVVRWILTH